MLIFGSNMISNVFMHDGRRKKEGMNNAEKLIDEKLETSCMPEACRGTLDRVPDMPGQRYSILTWILFLFSCSAINRPLSYHNITTHMLNTLFFSCMSPGPNSSQSIIVFLQIHLTATLAMQ